jgi:hypothetical protein
MAAISLATLRLRVQQLGNYENSARFTTAFLNDQINAALVELYELMSSTHEGYFDTTATVTTIAATDAVSLPSNFWRLRGVDMLQSTGLYSELRQVAIGERNRYAASGCPSGYRTAAGGTRGQLVLYPTPDAVYTLRLVYEPTCPLLVADGDTVEDYNGLADYVVTGALLRCDRREQRPLAEREAELERIKRRVVSSATERRAAEPEHLIPRNGLLDTDYWNGGG